jgi:hypothetical protein
MAQIPATTLDDALDLLAPMPLEFPATGHPKNAATDPSLYIDPPPPDHEQSERRGPGPMDRVRKRLLTETNHTKVFLSGHVGAGKSTQINRLAADPRIQQAFTVVTLRFEEQEWANLDSAQVLFRMAGVLFEYGSEHKLLDKSKRWSSILDALDGQIFGPSGLQARPDQTGIELNLVFVKLRQELKLSEARRKQLRTLAETQQSLLQDLLAALVDDVEENLVKSGRSGSLLMLIDDLDKVRGADEQRDIFDENLNALLAPPFRALYTLPTGVSFGANRADVRRRAEHLYPVRVLQKAPETFDPLKAYRPDCFSFFQELLHHRVAPGLFDEEALRLAVVYSGGVLRELFHLLREGIFISQYNDLDTVDGISMREAIRDTRFRESAGIYLPDIEALLEVHRTNRLRDEGERRYLDLSRVLECYNDAVWFEANPLLWSLLETRARGGGGG